MRRATALLLSVATVAACQPKAPDSATAPASPAAATAPSATDHATTDLPAMSGVQTVMGPVLEQLAAPPYTYLRIKGAAGDVWAAVPEAKVTTGDIVTVYISMEMNKFESKTLKRTFEQVYFGDLTPPPAAASAATVVPTTGSPKAEAINVGKVAKATGADARTVAEVWAQKAALVGKTVTVRGVVAKYNENVMGKNWIHLQDGSGDPKLSTNDLTFTSLDGAAVGATIVVRGTVHLDKDFGAGYKYAVIVEDAKVLKP